MKSGSGKCKKCGMSTNWKKNVCRKHDPTEKKNKKVMASHGQFWVH